MSLCNREASVLRPSVCPSVCKLLHASRYFYHKHDSIATKLAHDGPHMGLHPGCAQGQVKVKGHVIRALLWCHEMFAIQYLLTFCLYMHSLYEAPLHFPSSTSVKQLDVMSTSWDELLRHWRSGFKNMVFVRMVQSGVEFKHLYLSSFFTISYLILIYYSFFVLSFCKAVLQGKNEWMNECCSFCTS